MPDSGCLCRKPGTRFLAWTAARYGIDLARSFVVGDQSTDVEMGIRNGCRTVLVRTGLGGDGGVGGPHPDFVVDDIAQAADRILGSKKGSGSFPAGQ